MQCGCTVSQFGLDGFGSHGEIVDVQMLWVRGMQSLQLRPVDFVALHDLQVPEGVCAFWVRILVKYVLDGDRKGELERAAKDKSTVW